MSRRRRSTMDRAFTSALGLVAWVKRPRWTPGLRTAALVGSVLFATYWTGSLIRGALAVGILLTAYGIYRVVSWFVTRRRLTLEAGLPVSAWRMVRDFAREREKFALVERRWERAVEANPGLKFGGHPLRLKRMRTTLAGDVQAFIDTGALGSDTEPVAKLTSSVLPAAMKCRDVSLVDTEPGRGWLTFYESDPLQRVLPVTNLPPADPDKIAFGVQQDGSAAQVVMGISMLIGGLTRSGKSSTVWAMLAGLNQRRVPVELWVSDAKGGMELEMFEQYARTQAKVGNIRVMGYTTTAEGTVAMMDQFAMGMFERQKATRGKDRKVLAPTEDHPLRIFLMDELLAVKSTLRTTNTKTSPTELVVNQGAATFDMVIALTQAALKSQIGDLRDAFPLRLCMRVKTLEGQKAILGDSVNLSCVKITDQQRGVGVYVTDDGTEMRFRSAYATTKQAHEIAAGRAPAGMVPYVAPGSASGSPCYVYRAFDRHDRLMYVGKTANREGTKARYEQHRRHDRKWCAEHQRVENWWNVHVDEARMWVVKCESPEHMDAVEQWAIENEHPVFNDLHNDDNPLSNMRLDGRAGTRQRLRDAGREWVELGKDEGAVRWADKRYRKQERVQRIAQRADERMHRVLAEAYRP